MPTTKTPEAGSQKPDKPYGYTLRIHFTDGTSEVFHKVGSEAAVRRWAKFKPHYKEVSELDPYTREQWNRTFGDPSIKGRWS